MERLIMIHFLPLSMKSGRKLRMTKDLEAKIHSGNYTAFIRQIGESIDRIHPVRILAFAAGTENQEVYLYIAHPQDVADGTTKEIKERGVSPEKVMEDLKDVRTSTRIRPLTPEAALDQIYNLLQRIKGYTPLHASEFQETSIRFLRPPCEKMDQYKGASEQLAIFS